MTRPRHEPELERLKRRRTFWTVLNEPMFIETSLLRMLCQTYGLMAIAISAGFALGRFMR